MKANNMIKFKIIKTLLLITYLSTSPPVAMDQGCENNNGENNSTKQQSKSGKKRKRSDSGDELNQDLVKHTKDECELGLNNIVVTEIEKQSHFAWEDEEPDFANNYNNQDMINDNDSNIITLNALFEA